MPVQHADDGVLKRMGRKITGEGLYNLIRDLRNCVPNIALRTTILTGFPGETEKAFEHLCEFIREVKFERLGVFGYSRELGTPAARMRNQIDPEEIQFRRDVLMRIQQEIHKEKQESLIGKVIPVMVDEIRSDGLYIGRSIWDAPDVDTIAAFTASEKLTSGQVVHMLVRETDDYDIKGTRYESAQ
jgi:ribosomal protein S12 methylthiotransferase